MAETIKDAVFGDMEYRHRWVKKEEIFLFGKKRTVSIVASAYSGETICDEQRQRYKEFKKNVKEISAKIPQMVFEYVEAYKTEMNVHFDLPDGVDKVADLVEPTSVLFTRDGKVVIMCNALWDEENGIGIEVLPEYKVDLQDAFI